MITIKQIFIILLLVQICFCALAQRKKKDKIQINQTPKQELIYGNKNYIDQIQTVQFYPQDAESALPVYVLNEKNSLILSFDDLRADVRNLYYSIEHCNADWTPSRVSVLDYAEGYNEDRIVDYKPSQGTLLPYTNYTCTFPNQYVRPKIAGNYLLKVYEDADKTRLILTRRFYVVRPLAQISAEITNSSFSEKRRTNQKINVVVKSGLTISNPHRDIQVHVLQNQRSDNMIILQKPMFIGSNEIKYTLAETLDFEAGNEFRYADLRSFKGGSAQTKDILVDSITSVYLYTDEFNSKQTYASVHDENGRFYIRNLDYNDAFTNSDYATVYFSLSTSLEVKGSIYVVGGFNDFQRTENNRLSYNHDSKLWEVNLLLKQGLYDYEYVLEDEKGTLYPTTFSGSHWETGNDYQIIVYYRRTGTYWDEILGIKNISINNKENKN